MDIRPPKNGVQYRVLMSVRVSIEQEITGSHTLETQETRMRQLLAQLLLDHPYEIEVFIEDGISGSYGPESTGIEKRSRPVLKQASDLVKSGEYDIWIVYDLSRFLRSTRWLLQLREDVILPTKTKFISVSEKLDLETPEGLTMATVLSAINQNQREGIIRRTRDAAARRAELGYVHGQPSYGWRWQDAGTIAIGGRRGIVPVPEQARWVTHIKERYLSGWSLTKIAAELEELGVPAASGQCVWHPSVVGKILQCPLHAGLVPHRRSGGTCQGQHFEHRFYDPEVLEQIKAVAATRKKIPTNSSKAEQYLLNGLVSCGLCGKRMYPVNYANKAAAFACMAGLNRGGKPCTGQRVRQFLLDDLVVAEMQRLAKLPEMEELVRQEAEAAIVQQHGDLQMQQKQLQSHLEKLKAKSKVWADALADGTMKKDVYRELSAGLIQEQQGVRCRLEEIETTLLQQRQRQASIDDVAQVLQKFPLVWHELLQAERRQVVQSVIERLSVQRQPSGETLVRLKLHWLPETETMLPRYVVPPRYKTKRETAGLTKRHLTLLYWLDQGKTPQEASREMRVGYDTVRTFLMQIRKVMGRQDMSEIIALARGRIQAELLSLSLQGLRSPQVKARAVEEGGIYVSPKMMQVLPLLARGAGIKEIVELTGLSATTVQGRRADLLELFEVKTVFQLGQKARALGIL